MCRSIKTLRPPYAEDVTDQDMRAAALQYVRKISGFRTPAARNAAVFDAAVEEIAAATARLLESLEIHPHQHPHSHQQEHEHEHQHASHS
jgi:hypothetical protein